MGDLETEAKKFAGKKQKKVSEIPLTARIYLAGQALTGLLSGGGATRSDEIKRAAYDWADYMLEEK